MVALRACDVDVKVECSRCGFERIVGCHEHQASGPQLRCSNRVKKLCGVCGMRDVLVPCSQASVECKEECTMKVNDFFIFISSVCILICVVLFSRI